MYSHEAVCVNVFLASPNGALKGSERIFVSGGLCEYLVAGPNRAIRASGEIFLSGGLHQYVFVWSQCGSVSEDIPVRWSA